LEEIAEKNGLFLLEDAAQGLGGQVNNRRAGSFGDIAATSFFPAKPLGCYGDGGAVFTDDDAIAERLQSIRNHGMGKDRYDNVRAGLNGRLDTLQAAVLLSKMTIFPEELDKRNEIARVYTAGLRGSVEVPTIPEGTVSAWAQYSLLLENKAARDRCGEALEAEGVPSAIYYPIPLHLQTVYQDLGYKKGSLPVAEDIADRIISIPMHPYLTTDEIENVINVINSSVAR
jgi:dTDP-4-amino-4,6-dideoxygalactose transaminase